MWKNSRILVLFITVWDKYDFLVRMNIRMVCYHRYWTNESPTIFGRKKRSQINIQISLPQDKISECIGEWIYSLKVFKYIQISDYLPNIVYEYLGHFHSLCSFLPTLNRFWPKKNNFWVQWKFKYIHSHIYCTNEYSNMFVSINRSWMIIWTYLPWKKSTNILANEYTCLTIFKYI